MKLLICRLFGHRIPDKTVTAFWTGSNLVWQCPRCKRIVESEAS
jgi:hypothetical protein